jgi:hypothetical protein
MNRSTSPQLPVTGCAMSDDGDMYVDDIGRIFCSAHRRAVCHSCFYNFEIMNSMAEERAGLRKCVDHVPWLRDAHEYASACMQGSSSSSADLEAWQPLARALAVL